MNETPTWVHAAFIKRQRHDADPSTLWLFVDTHSWPEPELAFRHRIELMVAAKPVGVDPGLPGPLMASSWRDCEKAGLVQIGWSYPRGWPEPLHWGICLTDKGRQALA
tara:strand:- start:312 stop:635 length:324 start_codon:yes stop_codon:yes gene_type:complete